MDPVAKKILNALKCPICAAQIDICDGKNLVPRRKANFGCASNKDHYSFWMDDGEGFSFQIEEEYLNVVDNKFRYEIIQFHSKMLNMHQTNIQIYDVNGDGNIIEGNKVKLLTFKKQLFKFSKTNRIKIINRLKTILVFQ